MPSVVLEEPFEVGIDYLTATKRRGRSAVEFLKLGERLVVQEERRGNEVRPWGMSGYKGFRAGSSEVGTRADSYIIRLSAAHADENWSKVYALCDNVSRIDLQATVRTEDPPSRVIAREYKRMARFSNASPRAPVAQILRSSRGPATIYSGRRQSDRFGRIYDKGAESGLDHYEGTVRFEEELKGKVAMLVASQLFRSKRRRSLVYAGVSQFFVERGGSSWPLLESSLECRVCRTRPDATRRLQWLADSVRGTIDWLRARGYDAELLEALGLDESLSSHKNKLRRVA